MFLAGLVVACQPPKSDQQSTSGECLGDDCQENAAVHAIGGEEGIVTGEVQPASGTQAVALNNLGPDASDGTTYPIYAQATKVPIYKDGSVQPGYPAHYVDGSVDNSVRLDGGNFTLDADTTGVGATLTVALSPTDTGTGTSAFEYLDFKGDSNFELSHGKKSGDLIRDPSGTSTVIGTFPTATDGRGQDLVVSFNANANIADIEDLILGLTYNHSGSGTDFTVGDRALDVTYNDGSGTDATSTGTVTVEATASPTVVFSTTTGAYTEGTDLTLDSALALYDDAVTFTGADIVISAADCQSSEDVLQLSSAQTNVVETYTSGSCSLALTPTSGNLTLSQLLSGLQAVEYSNSSDTPTTSDRTINFAVTDAAANTTISADFEVSVSAVND
ncbi:MAG: hypothetical protein P8R54_27820, partial [Myxococcota bacterium]|nr:hypothetical protein [Myxococcota bacterium]